MREICMKCRRPINACYCKNIKEHQNRIEISILVHPDEKDHPLGTALMTKLTFLNSRIYYGVNFSSEYDLIKKINNLNTIILYPSELSVPLKEYKSVKAVQHLIILDGTWRKAKRILNETNELKTLPLVRLDLLKKSIYEIRKAPKENYLSTLEATVEALNFLEDKNYNDSLNVLKEQVKLHKSYMGKKYEKFYKD